MRYVTSNERIAKAEGIQQGMQQGIEQGLQQGQARVLARLLTHRFGDLPDWARTRLGQATDDELDFWTAAVLSAASIEQVFGNGRH